MKIHLMIMTAMLSLCITHNGEAQDNEELDTTKKSTGETCASADECQSNLCTDNKCAAATETAVGQPPKEVTTMEPAAGKACQTAADCSSKVCTDEKKCGPGIKDKYMCADNPDECKSGSFLVAEPWMKFKNICKKSSRCS